MSVSAPRFCIPSALIHSVIRPTTGSSVGPNSVLDAFSMPPVFRAASMHAICMPRQMPKKGTFRSRAKRTLANLASDRSEEHTSELQSLMRHSYAVFCLKNNSNSELRAGAGISYHLPDVGGE